MSITKHKDPKTRKEYLLLEGVVDAVYFNELKNVKTYTNNGREWTPTHSINAVIAGTRVGLGLTDRNTLRAKDTEDNYQDVVKGVEVSVVIEENGEYNGVKQYTSRSSQITVLDTSGAVQVVDNSSRGGQGNAQPQQRGDNIGIIAGNARNVAVELASKAGKTDSKSILSLVKAVAEHTKGVREAFKAENGLNDFETGVAVGQAATMAATLSEDFEGWKDTLGMLLEDVHFQSVDIVKAIMDGGGEAKEPAKPKKAQKPVENDIADLDDNDSFPF